MSVAHAESLAQIEFAARAIIPIAGSPEAFAKEMRVAAACSGRCIIELVSFIFRRKNELTPISAQGAWECFNPRPRVGGYCGSVAEGWPKAGFQSTPPRGGRLDRRRYHGADAACFNPRPRVGGDLARTLRRGQAAKVSIHAPAWGATRLPAGRALAIGVSIHAPAWGATDRSSGTTLAGSSFNPRPRVGGDSPVEGVTLATGFNPRPRVGGDAVRAARRRPSRSFNPRPRVGGDSAVRARPPRRVSIHAPAWGATAGVDAIDGPSSFNPRPRVGGDTRRRWL